MNVRIAIRGLTIALFGAALALPATALGDSSGNGGTAPPQPAADGPVDPNFALSARHTVFLGKTLHVAGTDKSAAGQTVTVEARQGNDPWESVASVAVAPDGGFSTSWRPDGSGQFQIRGVLAGASTADNTPSSSAPRTVVVYKSAIATWYGPGFFGKKTACGERLTRTLLGVANRQLPCGTQVQVSYRGRTLVAPVIDRGPFAHHAQWDLTAAAAKQLGMTVTSRIGAAPLDLLLESPGL
ncbi:MAG TPA: septal ring lytic transglycosylase RlpA family protein [Thermoleophilaceae bacterium]|jgi:rare lipoprotein A (peptidoglycan hydrolase)